MAWLPHPGLRGGLRGGLVAIALFTSGAAVAETPCPAERASYAMHSEEGEFLVRLAPAGNWASAASDLYLRLTTPLRDYWFIFSASQGYGGTTLLPIRDPLTPEALENGPQSLLAEPTDEAEEQEQIMLLSSLRFMAMDSDLAVAPLPPASGEPAPQFLMMPEIGATLWYDPVSLTGDHDAPRDPMPRGVFRLAACLADAAP